MSAFVSRAREVSSPVIRQTDQAQIVGPPAEELVLLRGVLDLLGLVHRIWRYVRR